ncbi:MAG: hypothetical protein GXY34_08825 [Syntrophomonadaceae bacterium]|nr:hypothetical protein [Syntrophomonadaceae bacterium]
MWEEFMTPGEVDNRIKVYKVNEKGVKELVRVDKFNPFEHEMEDDEMAKPQLDINWEPVIKRGHELVDEGLSLAQAAKTIRDEMNLDCSVASIYNRIKFEKQQAQYVTPQNGIPKLSPQAFIKSRQMRAEMLIEGLLKDALALQLVKEMVERGII